MQHACAVLYYLWPVWLYHIFPHYLIKARISGGGGGGYLFNLKFFFWFCLNILCEKFEIE
jgi:hypothetical protein